MDICNLKWIFILFCIFVALSGLYLAFIREHKNIKSGAADLQDGSGNLKDGTVSFKFAIGLVLILIGVIGGYLAIKNLPGCDSNIFSDNKSAKPNNDSVVVKTDTSKRSSEKNFGDSAKNKSTSDSSTIKKNNPKTNQRKVVWKVDEEIVKNTKSVPRYIYDLPNQNPITLKITGFISYPVLEKGQSVYASPDPNVTLQVFINNQTNPLWNINFLHEDDGINHEISKTITVEKPKSELKFEVLLSNLPAFKDYDRYKNAILIKGFQIQIID
jgi:hypothetical protein